MHIRIGGYDDSLHSQILYADTQAPMEEGVHEVVLIFSEEYDDEGEYKERVIGSLPAFVRVAVIPIECRESVESEKAVSVAFRKDFLSALSLPDDHNCCSDLSWNEHAAWVPILQDDEDGHGVYMTFMNVQGAPEEYPSWAPGPWMG